MTQIKSKRNRRVLMIAGAVLLSLLSFTYGFVSGKFQIFPYNFIAATRDTAAYPFEPDSVSERVTTGFYGFRKTTYNRKGSLGLYGKGGALETIGSTILGIDSKAQFFRYDGNGVAQLLPIAIETNEDQLVSYAVSLGLRDSLSLIEDSLWQLNFDFRTMGLVARDRPEEVSLMVFHNHWDDVVKGKTSRISRLKIPRRDVQAFLDGTVSIGAEDWEVIFDSHPILPFDHRPVAEFNHNQSGGRMAIDSEGYLIVGIGDQLHNFDNSTEPYRPQDPSNSYGKFFRIDLESLDVDVFALGTRNPEGLLTDRDGNVWSTEHGPQGGDELNLVYRGANYGWPYETYGTQYGTYAWPLADRQGRHLKYQRPIFSWIPSIGISNLIQVSDLLNEWDGDLLVSSLRAQSLYRLRIRENSVVFVEPIFVGDRIRDLVQMRDGRILLWADSARFIELVRS